MHMFREGQFAMARTVMTSFADQFYALAGQVRQFEGHSATLGKFRTLIYIETVPFATSS